MAPTPPPDPRHRAAWSELGDLLGPAIEQVRRDPPPTDIMARALERARQIDQPRPRPWILRRPQFLLSTVAAAAVLIILVLRFGSYPQEGYRAGDPDPASMGPLAHAPSTGAPGIPTHNTILLRGGGYQTPGTNDDVTTIGIADVGNAWGAWERVQGLRMLTEGVPVVDQRAMEQHLRHLGSGLASPVVYRPGHGRSAPGLQAADGRTLPLLGVSVQVLVEGPRARTLLDMIFNNVNDESLEPVLDVPLPAGASISFFACFPGSQGLAHTAPATGGPKVPHPMPTPLETMKGIDPGCWGTPTLGSVVPARTLSEAPALPVQALQTSNDAPFARGATPSLGFRGPIGVVRARTMIRVLVAYEELLPLRSGRIVYHHDLPACPLQDLSFKLEASADLSDPKLSLEDAQREQSGSRVHFARKWRKPGPLAPVVFSARPAQPSVEAVSGKHVNGSRYLYARLHPDIPARDRSVFARNAVFVLDTSAREQPERFARSVKLMTSILEADHEIERFNVLAFATDAGWLEPAGWLPNTKQARDRALASLDGVLLEGACDVSCAAAALASPPPGLARGTPTHAFLLSDGRVNWGETDVARLGALLHNGPLNLRWHCYQMEQGEENPALFSELTRTGGGVYRCPANCDLSTVALAHRCSCLLVDRITFAGGPAAQDVLLAGRRAAIAPGGDLVVAARFARPGTVRLVVEGKVGNEPFRSEFPVEVGDTGQLAPRGWGELAVASLAQSRDPRLDSLATTYAREFAVASHLTAFALGAPRAPDPDEERKRLLLPRAELASLVESGAALLNRPMTADQARARLVRQVQVWGNTEPLRAELSMLVELIRSEELTHSVTRLASLPTRRAATDPAYVKARQADPKAIDPYLDEAERRSKAGDAAGAVRCLTGMLDWHPDNADVIKVVGYRLAARGQASLAVDLFTRHVERYAGDPGMHRALAVALQTADLAGLAVLHYEITLGLLGNGSGWRSAVLEEYAQLLHGLMRDPRQPARLRKHLEQRWRALDLDGPTGLRVAATWNTTATAVALRVVAPGGKDLLVVGPTVAKSQGPRICSVSRPEKGTYQVEIEVTRHNAEMLAESCVLVEIARNVGKNEKRTRELILVRKQGEKHRLNLAEVK